MHIWGQLAISTTQLKKQEHVQCDKIEPEVWKHGTD